MSDVRAVGFIGLGDQGLPMATAVAEKGFDLHVWARHASSLQQLRDTERTEAGSVEDLAGAVDVLALCVSEDDDVLDLAKTALRALKRGSVVVNHGTGTPANAQRLTELCGEHGVDVLDAPVSGGRPAAESRSLTVYVGGDEPVFDRCEPVFKTFASHVVRIGGTGAGQYAKLFNNGLLMLNQAAIADVLALAVQVQVDPSRLVDALRLGSATSDALTLFGSMVTPDTVQHLSEVEALDMHLLDRAMQDAHVDADDVTERGLTGAQRMPEVVGRLYP